MEFKYDNYGLLFGFIVYYVPWMWIYLALRIVRIRFYKLSNPDICRQIQKKIKLTSHTTDTGKPYGYTFGRWYILSLSISENIKNENFDRISGWIITTQSIFSQLTTESDDTIINKSVIRTNDQHMVDVFSILTKGGSYSNIWYRSRKFAIKRKTPTNSQVAIIDQIIKTYKENSNQAVVYLYGETGSGKTSIGIFLTNILKGTYYNSFKPWEPSETLSLLYSENEPDENKPLIISIDEFDKVLELINNNEIQMHKSYPISVKDKAGWNNLFDEISLGLYPNMIILLTSNKTPDYINSKIDPSYIRSGRVNLTVRI